MDKHVHNLSLVKYAYQNIGSDLVEENSTRKEKKIRGKIGGDIYFIYFVSDRPLKRHFLQDNSNKGPCYHLFNTRIWLETTV